MVKVQHCFVHNGGLFFAVFGKTRILLENPGTEIERFHKKK
jgi:hypothetical protein